SILLLGAFSQSIKLTFSILVLDGFLLCWNPGLSSRRRSKASSLRWRKSIQSYLSLGRLLFPPIHRLSVRTSSTYSLATLKQSLQDSMNACQGVCIKCQIVARRQKLIPHSDRGPEFNRGVKNRSAGV